MTAMSAGHRETPVPGGRDRAERQLVARREHGAERLPRIERPRHGLIAGIRPVALEDIPDEDGIGHLAGADEGTRVAVEPLTADGGGLDTAKKGDGSAPPREQVADGQLRPARLVMQDRGRRRRTQGPG